MFKLCNFIGGVPPVTHLPPVRKFHRRPASRHLLFRPLLNESPQVRGPPGRPAGQNWWYSASPPPRVGVVPGHRSCSSPLVGSVCDSFVRKRAEARRTASSSRCCSSGAREEYPLPHPPALMSPLPFEEEGTGPRMPKSGVNGMSNNLEIWALKNILELCSEHEELHKFADKL